MSEKSLSIFLANKHSGFQHLFVFQKNIAIKRTFLRALKEGYFLPSGHRNVAFLPVFRG